MYQHRQLPNEIWLPVVGYEGYYEVSNHGRVRSLDRTIVRSGQRKSFVQKGRILHFGTDRKGYKNVGLSLDNKTIHFPVHRLVAIAFVENQNNYNIVNHKDENPSNNVPENLEWCTHRYNSMYGTAQIRKGAKHSDTMSKAIIQMTLDGTPIREFKNKRAVKAELGFDFKGVWNCCRGFQKQSHGYKWKYKDEEF